MKLIRPFQCYSASPMSILYYYCLVLLVIFQEFSVAVSFASELTNAVTINHSITNPSTATDAITSSITTKQIPPPIVYTIAGSDSGGGAGIQADLHAIQAFGCHGCSAITCLTAQNSIGVTTIHTPPISFLQEQLHVLHNDLPPISIKIGMLGTPEIAKTVGDFLRTLRQQERDCNENSGSKVWVVLDPVMISTSGYRLISNDTQQIMIEEIFPYVDIITPNKYEAEALLGGRLFNSTADIEKGAYDILKLGVSAVLLKGGHTTTTVEEHDEQYAQDYFLSSAKYFTKSSDFEPRICDSVKGCWMQSQRYNTEHTHGTGCTLSSSIAAALAIGEQARRRHRENKLQQQQSRVYDNDDRYSYATSIDLISACCLAKAYVTAGIESGVQLGQGPGPVRHTTFPMTSQHYPTIVPSVSTPFVTKRRFPFMKAFQSQQPLVTKNIATTKTKATLLDDDNDDDIPVLGSIIPIVDTLEWIERLCATKQVSDVQLRIKNVQSMIDVKELVQTAQALCHKANVRLWINDYWDVAIDTGCYGIHVGQEDLFRCVQAGGIDKIHHAGLAFGISTHSFAELSVAIGMKPSYISLGPIYPTGSKNVNFDPQGLSTVTLWRKLIPSKIPLIAIGGISSPTLAKSVMEAGADCIAVIGAITQQHDTDRAVEELVKATSFSKH
jgi:hydroxymethylpyrimidine kinase / phosphomethylpyrimidine kinase / thiamine-phosphate diphosphorylase